MTSYIYTYTTERVGLNEKSNKIKAFTKENHIENKKKDEKYCVNYKI